MIRAPCRRLAVLLLAAWAAGAASLARAADPPPAPRWHADVFFFCQRQLVVLRLYVRLDGRDPPAAWDRATAKFFKSCDADHDGQLAGPEKRRVPTPEQLAQFGLTQPVAPSRADRAGSAQRVQVAIETVMNAVQQKSQAGHVGSAAATMSLEQFKEYLRSAGVGPFLLEGEPTAASASAGSDEAEERGTQSQLFLALDADANGRLSREELQKAARRLHRYDLDEDGRLTRQEILLSSPATYGYRPGAAQRTGPQLAATVASAGSAMALAVRIMDHYDRPLSSAGGKDGKLSAAELGWKTKALRSHDADGDGQLDFDELARFVARPTPTVSFAVRRGNQSVRSGLAKFVGGLFSGGSAADDAADDSAEWDFPSARLELSVVAASPASGFVMGQMFGVADRDKNKYLDEKEFAILSSGAALFQYLDFDGDGKVFEAEWVADGGRLLALGEAQTRLQVSDLGRPLFEAVDVDGDDKLDHHELDDLIQRLNAWDSDGDFAVSPGEVPRLLRIAASNEARLFGLSFASSVRTSVQTTSAPDATPPDWFRAMDRNSDGELSRLEFVGELERFQQLDADHDGFVSAEESSPKPAAKR